MWSDVTPLTFSEVSSEEDGDFKLEFVAGEHRDGPQNAFDGPGIALISTTVITVFVLVMDRMCTLLFSYHAN